MHPQKLRQLDLVAAPQSGRPAYLSAASGLVRVGENFYVVADDELQLGAFPVDANVPGTLLRMLPGDLPDALKDRKKAKPDFEALTVLAPFIGYPGGAILALGSGGKKPRRRGVLLGIHNSVVSTSPRVIDADNLFDAVDKEVDDLNIEGVVAVGDRLLLMHRGNKSHATSAIISLRLSAVLRSIEHDDRIGKVPIDDIRHYSLGAIDGVPLCFTDGTALCDGRLIFCAVAEDTTDSYCDGPCLAAAIGVIGIDGKVSTIHYLDELYKVEGIHAESTAGRIKLWLVTDADDVKVPAVLLTSELSL